MVDEDRRRTLEAAAIESADQGLKGLLLLNGGACVALLAFVGSTATSSSLRPEFVPLINVATHSLIWFASGAGLAVLACIPAYKANQSYANHLHNPTKIKWSTGDRYASVALGIAIFSLFCFIVGVVQMALSLTDSAAVPTIPPVITRLLKSIIALIFPWV
ncbi:hypothetical protein IFT84_13045 [Rhizobium sp. CFBP 8762]|uniref:hypothetical protein n=1 Tax=Rhizobium sp. CFBP 8762 TaxID=2775279 RepID=UPI00178310D2|nr:hypothetical protein [Rhizobium sp. CFBP 8762]MBD8555431.1 hypothetical protein [Rhizobium sp. CFBP 8762]